MNRRGFLGFFAGAAAAGPKLATGIAENVALPMASLPGSSAVVCASDDGEYRRSRIAELKRIITGKDPQTERDAAMQRLYSAEQRERVRLDSLRSVSPAHKIRMLVDGDASRRARIRKQYAQFELSDFLKRA